MAFGHLLADKGIDPGPIAFAHQEAVHLLPSGGQLIQDGHIQITVHDQRQGPGNGRGGHHQQMGVRTLGGQLRPLRHTKAVLLIGNDHTQVRKHRSIGQQRMSAHRQINGAGGNGLPDGLLFRLLHRAGQQPNTQTQRRKQLLQGLVMLLSQDLRRRHQCRLLVIVSRQIGRSGSHHSLAAAHIALDQAVHGRAPAHIGSDFVDGPLLSARQGKGQRPVKGLQIGIFIRGSGFLCPSRPEQAQACGEHKELLKDQPPLCQLRLLYGGRLVDGIIGPFRRQDAVLAAHRLRNDLRRHIADSQRLPHRLEHSGVGQSRRQRIDRQHAPGGDGRAVDRLKDRIGHAVAGKIAVDGAVEDVFLAVVKLIGHIAVVEEGHIQPAGVISQLHLGHVQSLADVGSPGCIHHHCLEAGRSVRLQLTDGDQPGPILISPREMADQIPKGANIQVFKLLGLGRANAFKYGDGIR